ncbi:MAG TPA: phenylacetate--CoA ligase, partial [Casimicrobiaceae bacterium]|nr:phenylacetate--CoA ligase [Casimicrobiaceae bacterium]
MIRPRLGATHLEGYRNRQLRRLLRHAAANVPYYRALWTSSGTRWEDVRSVDDIGSLPVTSKASLRRLPRESMLDASLDPDALLHHATSGSTGIPTHVWRTPIEERRLNLFRWRALRTLGLRLGDRIA